MVVIVSLNLVIALIGFYATWRVCRLRRTLAKVADILASAERSTHQILHKAPEAITRGQVGIYQLRQAYRLSGPQLQRVRQALLLLGLGRSLWRQPSPLMRPSFLVRRGVRPARTR